ncbi:MAG: N-acetyltransferase [Actinomycetota bacterium]
MSDDPPFVPADFEVPDTLVGLGWRLEPLGPEHNERDHAAWSSSIDHIRASPGWAVSSWPTEMSLADNLGDLEMHARHFEERVGFTYSVLDGDDVVGCLYIYPPSDRRPELAGHDAEVRSWVRADRAELDREVWHGVSRWLAEAWPFTDPHYDQRPT